MNNKVFSLLCAVIAIGASVWISSTWFSPRIGYVRSGVLVEKYKGMMEARNLYKQKMSQWQANIDTLESDYKKSFGRFNAEMPELSAREKLEREESLRKQEVNIRQYISALEQKAKEEDAKLTEGVLNQINSYVKQYGEEHDLDVILGSTMEGNIMYGKETRDITDEVLSGLNGSYQNSTSEKK